MGKEPPMNLFTFLNSVEIGFCLAALGILLVKGLGKDYWALGSFLAVRVAADVTLTAMTLWLSRVDLYLAYHIYFWVYWMAFAVESILALFIVYGVFRLTLGPLRGLLKVGTILLGVVAAFSELWALGSAVGSHSAARYLITAVSQLQRNQSLFTLGTLLLVFFAMRFAGISSRSKIFGVALGLGALAINDLVRSAWLAANPGMRVNYNVINSVVVCAAMVLWAVYCALPEPERGEIDPYSPLLRWNRICQGWFA
jgi:hypothetical protein